MQSVVTLVQYVIKLVQYGVTLVQYKTALVQYVEPTLHRGNSYQVHKVHRSNCIAICANGIKKCLATGPRGDSVQG